MNRQVVKTLQDGNAPKVYIRVIADLEDLITETHQKQKASTKKMSPSNTKGLNAMRQKIRKNNASYTAQIQKYQEDKDAFMEESEDEGPAVAAPKERKTKIQRIDDLEAAIDEEGFATVGRGGKALVYTPESILKHLRSIIESRGKKNTDRTEQISDHGETAGSCQHPLPEDQGPSYLSIDTLRRDRYIHPELHVSGVVEGCGA